MANCTNILLLIVFTATLLSTTTTTTAKVHDDAYPSVFSTPPFQFSLSNTSYVANVLSTLGFQQLAYAALNLTMITTPVTIFAPSGSSLRRCVWCDVPLILQEYSAPGLYTFDAITKLPSETTRPNFVPKGCFNVLSLEDLDHPEIVFVNDVQIVGPEVYNDGLVIVHVLYGYVRHLPANSCFMPWYKRLWWRATQ